MKLQPCRCRSGRWSGRRRRSRLSRTFWSRSTPQYINRIILSCRSSYHIWPLSQWGLPKRVIPACSHAPGTYTDLPGGMFSDIRSSTQCTSISTDTKLLLPFNTTSTCTFTVPFMGTAETHPGGRPYNHAQSHSALARGDWERPRQPESPGHGTSASEGIELQDAISKQSLD